MFSKTCEHAIRAMIFIARRSKEGGRAGVREIAEAAGAPEAFIAKILQDLGRKGLVQSQKGPTGGFFVDQSAKNSSLADIVRAVDGNGLFTGCGLGLPECSESHPCPLHDAFKKIRKDISDLLERSLLDALEGKLNTLEGELNKRPDITDLDDIRKLVDTFYGKVREDKLLAPIFFGVIRDRWPVHLEKMYRFWQTVLLEEHTYFGSPFPPHGRLPIAQHHFDAWLQLWHETIDDLFQGEKATEAKWRAGKMAVVFLSKLAG